MGGTFDFRVTPNPNFMLDVNLDEEFENQQILTLFANSFDSSFLVANLSLSNSTNLDMLSIAEYVVSYNCNITLKIYLHQFYWWVWPVSTFSS